MGENRGGQNADILTKDLFPEQSEYFIRTGKGVKIHFHVFICVGAFIQMW